MLQRTESREHRLAVRPKFYVSVFCVQSNPASFAVKREKAGETDNEIPVFGIP